MQLSLDGVQEAKSSSVTTDTYTASFPNCNKVYPIRLVRPNNRFRYDEQEQIKNVISDINSCSCRISKAILDNPKRAIVKCTLCHSATYACEYCEGNAVLVHENCLAIERATIKKRYELRRKELKNMIQFLRESPGSVKSKEKDVKKIEELEVLLANLDTQQIIEIEKCSKKQLAWPFSTMNARLRTNDLIKYVVAKISRSPSEVDKHERKGLRGKSHLLYQENFNFIDDVPAEYMHLGCLGVVKRMLQLTFNTGENRSKTSKRKLSDTSDFNRAIKAIQVIREFGRRCRNLDLGIIKAQEYRNICIFFFKLVIDCIDDKFPQEKKVWLYLTYIMRACIIPNQEFAEIDRNDVKECARNFYKLFEQCFGEHNCSYSIHVFPSHILRIRGDNPLTETSAFKYESFYSEMKNLFQPGTTSPTKQILQNTLMKRILEPHCCKKPIKYDTIQKKKKGLENNSMIYVFDQESNKHLFYNIIEKQSNNTFKCTEQGRFNYTCDYTPEINWPSVGVYKLGPSNLKEKIIREEEIGGKVIKVQNLLITCPKNVIYEQ